MGELSTPFLILLAPVLGKGLPESSNSDLLVIKGMLLRFVARVLDVTFGFLFCYFLHWYLGRYFATRAVVTFLIGNPNSCWKGIIPCLLGLFGTYFYTLPLALFLIFLPEAIWGWSFGKLIVGLRIKNQDGLSAPLNKLWLRFILKTSLFSGITLALVLGNWVLAAIVLVGGSFILLTALPDRLTGTLVSSR